MKVKYQTISTPLILLLFIIGCATPKSTVVLLNNKKSHNAIIVSNDRGCLKLDKVREFVNLHDKDKAPRGAKIMSKNELKRRFGKVLDTLPPKVPRFFLYFKPNTMDLAHASQKRIGEVITSILDNSPCNVDIIGHTDTVGLKKVNIETSLKQAHNVQVILKAKILNALQDKKYITLRTKGYGEEDLLIPTPNNYAEEKNRNVEVVIQ